MDFPVEIVERIVRFCGQDQVGEYKALIQLGQVNRQFHRWTRPYLYQHLRLSIANSQRLSKLLSLLTNEPKLRAWVQELTVSGLDPPPFFATRAADLQKGERSILSIISTLAQSPITSLSFMAFPQIGDVTNTPILKRIVQKTFEMFTTIRSLTIANGSFVPLDKIAQMPQLDTLILHNTQPYDDLPSIPVPPNHVPLRLKRFRYIVQDDSDTYDGWEAETDTDEDRKSIVVFDELEEFQFSLGDSTEWYDLISVVLPACSSTLVCLSLVVWNFDGLSGFWTLEGLVVLKELHFNFVNCASQFGPDSILDIDTDDDDDDDNPVGVFEGLSPPPSLQKLIITLEYDLECDVFVGRFLKRALPELDQEIATNRDTCWLGLRSVEFETDAKTLPCKKRHMSRVRNLGISVTGLSFEEDDEQDDSEQELSEDESESD